jgi:5-formyltetrahydrofolate cyclo-ligase
MNKERWQGRNSEKDSLRRRIWSFLESSKAGIAPIWSAIPDFNGAEEAAERLSQLSSWSSARIVKSNPDAPQIPVRRKALEQGKIVYTPVPELVKDFPFLRLDPDELRAKGVSFEIAATPAGALEYGARVQFTEMEQIDICVVGCVAVTRIGGRTGKGGGFADLELGIFRELGKISANAPIVTTVHDIQVVPDDELVMMPHDSALHWIFTPTETIETNTQLPQPQGVAWDMVQADQYRDVPFLSLLREQLTKRTDSR